MSVKRFVRVSTTLFAVAMAGSAVAEPLVISELRVRGPNGANDEFIEIYNQDPTPHTVAAASGTGYGVAASDGATRGTIPNGTVIPGHGHYLFVNSVAYSLASYPAGNGTTATGDATYTTDIPDNAGVALFNNNVGGGSYSLANRIDAVGSTSEANTLYKEGTGYPALTPFSIDYTFHRDACGKGGSITTFGDCPSAGALQDTNNNAADFVFEDTNGTSAGAGQRLGAPGPENLSSPVTNGTGLDEALVDTCTDGISLPNRVRDFTSDPPTTRRSAPWTSATRSPTTPAGASPGCASASSTSRRSRHRRPSPICARGAPPRSSSRSTGRRAARAPATSPSAGPPSSSRPASPTAVASTRPCRSIRSRSPRRWLPAHRSTCGSCWGSSKPATTSSRWSPRPCRWLASRPAC
jgi:hypothetical protein